EVSLASAHEDSVGPGEPSEPNGGLVDRRVSPELLLLDHVERQDLYLIAGGGQGLAELTAPCLGAADRRRIPLDEVQYLHGVSSWYTVMSSTRFPSGSSRMAFTE